MVASDTAQMRAAIGQKMSMFATRHGNPTQVFVERLRRAALVLKVRKSASRVQAFAATLVAMRSERNTAMGLITLPSVQRLRTEGALVPKAKRGVVLTQNLTFLDHVQWSVVTASQKRPVMIMMMDTPNHSPNSIVQRLLMEVVRA